MKLVQTVSGLLLCLGLVACNSGNAASEAAAATAAPAAMTAAPEPVPATTAGAANPAAPAAMPATQAAPPAADSATILKNTEAAVSKGMAYADFRKAVLAQGWQPLVDAQCRANVIGGNFEKLCAKNPARCQVCVDVPELSACSGDAHCLMQFTHAGVEGALQVTGYGEIKDWNVSGKNSALQVSGWEVGKVEAAD